MLTPKKEKQKIKLSKAQIRGARSVFRYILPYKFTFILGGILLICTTSIGLIFPLFLGQLLGSDAPVNDTGSAIRMINTQNINAAATALFILFGIQAIFSFFKVIVFTNMSENVMRDIRYDAFSKLLYLPLDYYNQNTVGELTSRLTSDVAQLQESLRVTIGELFRQIVVIVGGIFFLGLISIKLSLIMLSTVPVMAIFAVVFGKFIKKLSSRAQTETATSNTIVEESLMGISNVKAFTNELFMLLKYRKSIDEIRRLSIKGGYWRGLFVSFIVFCIFGAIVFIIWQGLLMTQGPSPELSQKDFYSFIMLTIMIGGSIGSLPEVYASIQKAVGATDNLMKIIDSQTEQNTATGSLKPSLTGNVRFDNVYFSYPQRQDSAILKGISLSADSNETIALVGSSGAGKTTISNLLLRFYEPDSGHIFFDGTKAEDIDLKFLRANIAVVPQEVILFNGSIRENIAFGKPEASDEDIEAAAKKANALDFIRSFPEGFDTSVGDRGIQLSGGQKQRIAIARALLKNPAILILDEATSALDAESEKMVQGALEELMKGRTSFVIAHRLSTIRNADHIFVINDGKVVEKGRHEDLITLENGIYSKLVRLQMHEA